MSNFKYIRNDKMFLPYTPKIVSFKEDVLVDIYKRLKNENLYEIIFHDNPQMTFNQFISFFSSELVSLSFFCVLENEVEYPAGMCWLTDFANIDNRGKRANGSFVFFKDFQKPNYTNDFGKMALDFWFHELGVSVISGLTPSDNRSAMIYIKRLGFIESGRIPNYTILNGNICDGVITYLERSAFEKRYPNG